MVAQAEFVQKYWYVLFTKVGCENLITQKIEKYFSDEEISPFLPLIEIFHKFANKKTIKEYKVMFPGYIFIESMFKDDVIYKKVRQFQINTNTKIKLLSYGDSKEYSIREEEKKLLFCLFSEDKTVGASTGVIHGDKVIITEGPLMGRESIIRKINRHRREAVVEMEILGRMTNITTGLNIIEKL